MANDFTPGPYWLNVAEDGECRVMGRNANIMFRYPASQAKLAEVHVRRLQKGHEEANARLIAAAPELYEAALAFSLGDPTARQKLLDALAKARGEQVSA